MNPKILTENGWKAIAQKFKIKDNGLLKALATYGKLPEEKFDERLRAITTVTQMATNLQKAKEVAAIRDVDKYLDEILSAAKAVPGEIKAAQALAEKKATEAKKQSQVAAKTATQQEDEDEEDETGDTLSKLKKALQTLKTAKKPYYCLVCDAKPYGLIISKKDIRKNAEARKELAKIAGGSTRPPKVGECRFEDGKHVFDMEKPPSGLARILQKWVKTATGVGIKVKVGTESAEDDEGPSDAAAKPGTTAKPVASPNDDQLKIAKQKPLGTIAWERHRATLWAMTDPAGAIARGGGKRQQADLAKMNEFGDQVVRAVAQMNALEGEWRQGVEAVRKAAAQSAIDIKQVEAELPAMRKHRREDENFFRDVDGYLSAMENAEGIIGQIRKAEAGLQKAASTLQSDEFWKKANYKENEVKDDEQAVAAKQAEIDEAKRIAGGILDIVEKVVKQDWSGLASKALEFARDQAIDASVEAQFGRDLADLKSKLAAAQSELKNLKIEALSKAVEASRFGVSEALINLDNAKQAFGTALVQIARLQTKASDTLKKSKSTAAVGVMLAQRSKQLHAIDVARSACERYGHISGMARKQMTLIANKYGAIGNWLSGAAAADPTFDRSKPYAKTLELSALSNSVELGRWDAWVNAVQGKCKESLSWVTDTGTKGPMVHFERAVAVTKEALVDPG